MKLGILSSHNGSNFQAVIDAIDSGVLDAEISVFMTNNSNSGAMKRAKKANIPAYHLSEKTQPSDRLDEQIFKTLRLHDVDVVLLLGYMKPIGRITLAAYSGRIYNIHPSLLPKHGGKGMFGGNVHKAVLENNETETGVTIHKVTEEYDTGPIVAQKKVPVYPDDTVETLSSRVLEVEHSFLIEVLKNTIQQKIIGS